MKITLNNSAQHTSRFTHCYSVTDAYAIDAAAIKSGIPAITLMKRAGTAAFNLLLERFPAVELITVYCGGGNNGGDGYILAGLAASRKLPVQVIQLASSESLRDDARLAYDYALTQGAEMVPFSHAQPPKVGVIVDALLGVGFRAPMRDDYAKAINHMNDAQLPVIALDVPSGLDADTGAIHGAAVRSLVCITFISFKRGLLAGRGPDVCGELVLASLDVPESAYQGTSPAADILQLEQLLPLLKPRSACAHKGDFGHVMVIGGDTGFGGAVIMAAEAAARSGAGLVSLATRPEHISAVLSRRPEIMVSGVVSGQELEPLLSRPSVLVVGPGLGRSPWSEQMLQQAVKTGLPLVLDADALNILAEGRVVSKTVTDDPKRGEWLLTPHPGEAARLLGITIDEVQANRFAAVTQLSAKYNATVILKGAGSLVVSKDRLIGIVTEGNPGMATGGMGDVLSGILGGLIAQGLLLADAARLGAVLHACAADLAAEDLGQRGLLATDLIPYVCELIK